MDSPPGRRRRRPACAGPSRLGDHVVVELPEERLERLGVLVGASGALLERHADGVELLAQPAHADTQHHPAPREQVEGGQLLGEDDGVALREDQDAGGELQGGRDRADPRQPHQWIGDVDVLAAGHAPVGRVGILGLVPRRHHHVLDGPDRLEPGRLRVARHRDRILGPRPRSRIREDDPELHLSNQVCIMVANIMSPPSLSWPLMKACMPSSLPAMKRMKFGRLMPRVTRGESAAPLATSHPLGDIVTARVCKPSGAVTSHWATAVWPPVFSGAKRSRMAWKIWSRTVSTPTAWTNSLISSSDRSSMSSASS